MSASPIQKFAAEAIGTFALVFVGAGVVIVESHTGPSHMDVTDGKVGLLGIALAHGTILSAMIYAVGGVSGGHFNPAVSFVAWLRQRIDANLFAGYVIAQIAAAIAAGLCLALLFPDEIALAGLGTPSLAPRITPMKGLLFEGFITFVFVTTIMLATREERGAGNLAGVAIGATLAALILFAGPLTGASANPARYLGPALISGQLSEMVVYVAGPFAGATLAALLTGFLADRGEADADAGELVAEAPPSAPAPAGPAEKVRRAISGAGKDQSPQARLTRAYELFEAGKLEVAAALVKPLLAEQDFAERARALLIVIEDELA